MLRDIAQHFPHDGLFLRARGEVRAVLRLTAIASDIHDHLLGDPQRQFMAPILCDKGQAKVHAGCDTSAGKQIAVANIDLVGPHACPWKLSGEMIDMIPMGGDLLSIQQSGMTERKSAIANRAKSPRSRRLLAQP